MKIYCIGIINLFRYSQLINRIELLLKIFHLLNKNLLNVSLRGGIILLSLPILDSIYLILMDKLSKLLPFRKAKAKL
jgi:hypothetical protein